MLVMGADQRGDDGPSAAEHQGSVSISRLTRRKMSSLAFFKKLLSGYPGHKVQRFDDGIGVVSDQVFCAMPCPRAQCWYVDALIKVVA